MGTRRVTPRAGPGRPAAGRRRATFPPAEGARVRWSEIPEPVRRVIEREFGSSVSVSLSQPGGFSPGVAARLTLADGRRAFLKAVSPESNPDSPDIHRREAAILAQMPPGVPVPRLLWHREIDGWVVLAIDDVGGRLPRLPWEPAELGRVLAALERLSDRLTPSPSLAPTFEEAHGENFTNWRDLVRVEGPRNGVPPTLDPWAVEHLDQLAELESRWTGGSRGETLLHSDLRADNLVVTDDRVYFVDWPAACRGAPWLDWVLFLPSVAMQGGPPPWELFGDVERRFRPSAVSVDAAIAALAGFFVLRSFRPPPPGLPTLRRFQRAQGVQTLRWLRYRTGWR